MVFSGHADWDEVVPEEIAHEWSVWSSQSLSSAHTSILLLQILLPITWIATLRKV